LQAVCVVLLLIVFVPELCFGVVVVGGAEEVTWQWVIVAILVIIGGGCDRSEMGVVAVMDSR
jgi:hypothetical protein